MANSSEDSYFARHYGEFRWAKESSTQSGFRPPQIGALHAMGAHCSQYTDRAIVTMPTGSGKTAVLCASCFVVEAKRVLVITPSRLVREQIVEDFENLGILRRLNAVDADTPNPKVFNAAGRVSTVEAWNALREYDVVVGTPSGLSPGTNGIPEPTADLFDLVLVDEAHHSPAASWKALLDHFADARQILFTATPFRRDQREIEGRFAYTYDLRSAYRDGVYGQLEYLPIVPTGDVNPDIAIAKRAEQVLLGDREEGLDHLLMVRTAQRSRARDLKKLYQDHTRLRLELVTGEQSLKKVRGVVEQLEKRVLDGIICVDMFGEGFDLPALKIAALHSPHKSLSVTLQFVGRFARTTGPRLGRAAFIALASEMSIEREHLYHEGAVWQEIIPALSTSRVLEEQTTQEVLRSFEVTAGEFTDVPDLSLHSIRPYFHVKVLNTGSDIELFDDIQMPGAGDVVYRFHSREHQTALYIVRTRTRPRWTTASHLDAISYELYVLHLHRQSGFLFICSSKRSDEVYQHFAEQFKRANAPVPRGLSSAVVQRALCEIEQLRFFHIGMRNGAASDRDASYVTMAGSAVDHTLERNDGRRYHRGHYFATGIEDEQAITLGVSTGSKFWSSMADRLPALIQWCDKIAGKLLHGRAPQTRTGIDHLGYGRQLDALPPDIVAADWDRRAYTHPMLIRYYAANGNECQAQLLDFDFQVERNRSTGSKVGLLFKYETYEYRATYSFDTERLIESEDDKREPIVIGERSMGLTAYLNERYPTLYTSAFSYVVGGDVYELAPDSVAAFDAQRVEAVDWGSAGVDRTLEVGPDSPRGRSIHSWLGQQLIDSEAQIVFYDHGSGEMADFVAVSSEEHRIVVSYYHCKKSGQQRSGGRVDDVYELCGQAAKSRNWQNMTRLCQQVESRMRTRAGGSRFLKGDLQTLQQLVEDTLPKSFQVVIVQPGLSRAAVSASVSRVLAAADEFIFGQAWRRMRIIGSA